MPALPAMGHSWSLIRASTRILHVPRPVHLRPTRRVGIGLEPPRHAPLPGAHTPERRGALACRRRWDIGMLVLHGLGTLGARRVRADAPRGSGVACCGSEFDAGRVEKLYLYAAPARDPAADVQRAHTVVLVPRDKADARLRRPARLYDPAVTTSKTRTRAHAARMHSATGSCSAAMTIRRRSKEFTDLCPARTQPAPCLGAWGRLRRAHGRGHNGMGGGGASCPTVSKSVYFALPSLRCDRASHNQVSAGICSNLRFHDAEHQ
ncbi:hypothetical protein C8R44DRAFT_895608 [Mycena epipterygia]|nr:hypothetical protein C8R44DRAFT_895608 [Mycena epipterygia]